MWVLIPLSHRALGEWSQPPNQCSLRSSVEQTRKQADNCGGTAAAAAASAAGIFNAASRLIADDTDIAAFRAQLVTARKKPDVVVAVRFWHIW